MHVEFSWDDKKDRANRRKHGISFSLAALVFSDENRKEQPDENSFDEERWITGKLKGRWFERRFKVVDEFAPELDAFAGAIQTGRPLQPDGIQGRIDVAIIRAIYESSKRRKPVSVRYS